MNIKVDSRNFNFYQKFGQIASFPKELLFDAPDKDYVQSIGDVRCTAITVCEVTTDKTRNKYDIQDIFGRIPTNESGANPKDALKAGIDYVKRIDGQKEKVWASYWQAHTGNFDAFDNIRSAISIAQNSITMWSPWHDNWANKQIIPKGNNVLGYHMYSIEGWTEIDGTTYLQIEAWVGYKLYMSREVLNDVIKNIVSNTAVLSTAEINERRKKTILETIIDAYKNLVILLELLLKQKKVVPIAEPQILTVTSTDKNFDLYNLSKSYIGKYLTLNPTVPKNVNCCQAMSFVLKSAGYNIPKNGISGTWDMKQWLDKNFVKIDTPKIGSIMIAVSGTGSKPEYRGHVFVYGNEASMSNDSTTGLWKAHWLNKNAKHYYGKTLGMTLHYYDPK